MFYGLDAPLIGQISYQFALDLIAFSELPDNRKG